MSTPELLAFVPDLMDRSRLGALAPTFAASLAELCELVDAAGPGRCTVVVDLSSPGVPAVAADLAGRGVRCVGFAPHVDAELRAESAAAGVQVLPRSRFFAAPAQVLGGPDVQPPSR